MINKPELINILQKSPQWIFLNYSSWSYLPWALFNCFCSIIDEKDPTKKELQILLNELPRILVLTANPKSLYTKNILSTLIKDFEGKESDHLLEHIQRANLWEKDSEIKIARMNPLYGSFSEFTSHFESLLMQYQPTHVIIKEPIKFDLDFSGREEVIKINEIEEFYENISILQGVHQVDKLITESHLYDIPFNQLDKGVLFSSFSRTIPNSLNCQVKMTRGYQDKGEFEVSYETRQGSYQRMKVVNTFKITCYHNGRIKI